ncbi:MAG: DEAD/DEAH box helicase [Thermomicrobiales bacterium]
MSGLTLTDQTVRVTFDAFDLDAYSLFIRTKRLPEQTLTFDWEADTYTIETAARFAPMLGAELDVPERTSLPLADHLFDYQRWAVDMALDSKRFALWADTGLGKTAMYLEWVRQVRAMTGGSVLILAPLAVIPQVVREAERFDAGDVWHLETREAMAHWCRDGRAIDGGPMLPPVAITNYEKFIPGVMPELRYLAGIVADESSILRTGGGTIKWNLIKSARGVEYKLSCTATPAPNEAMEYASQAAFLEKLRNEGDILWTYFQRDKYGVWSVKPHAQQAFFAFMASWSLYMRDPAAFGFADILATLPDPVMTEERIPLTDDQRTRLQDFAVRSGKGLFAEDRLGVKERIKFAQIARGFLYHGTGSSRRIEPVDSLKPEAVASRAITEMAAGRQVLVWTAFDAEGEIIARLVDDERAAILTGSQPDGERQTILDRFRAGEIRCLISKPSLIGYGLNLQFVTSMIFSGIDDSMERRYQAIRRAYRFGQTEPVHVYTPYIPELEGAMFTNVAAKEARFLSEVAAQESHYRKALGR